MKIGKIIKSSILNGVASITLSEEGNENNILEYTDLTVVTPVSLIINKTGQIVRIYRGKSTSPEDKKEYDIQIDVTPTPGLYDDFNSPEFVGLRVKIEEII